MMRGRRSRRRSNDATDMRDEVRRERGRARGHKQVARETKMRAVEQVCRGTVGVIPDGGTEAEEDIWQMIHPAGVPRGAGARDQAVLEGTVHPFDQSIALRMVRSRHAPGDTQQPAEVTPEASCELPAAIRNDGGRDTVPGDPMTE